MSTQPCTNFHWLMLMTNVKSQPICGPLGPNFDGFCANNTTKTKIGTFNLWKVPHSRKAKWPTRRGGRSAGFWPTSHLIRCGSAILTFYYAEPSKDQMTLELLLTYIPTYLHGMVSPYFTPLTTRGQRSTPRLMINATNGKYHSNGTALIKLDGS